MQPADWAAALATARLAQSAERKALNLVVVGSSPTVGVFSRSRAPLTHRDTHTHNNAGTHVDKLRHNGTYTHGGNHSGVIG